jgi:hypothetical protein
MRLKRGPESHVLAQDLYRGELALATDTQTVFAYDGTQKFPVGKAIVDSYDQITTYSGMEGRFFYAYDHGLLYVNHENNWLPTSDTPTADYLLWSDIDRNSSGLISGGALSTGTGGGTINVASGVGYINLGTGNGGSYRRVTWDNFVDQACVQITYNYVAIDINGNINISATEQDARNYIRLGCMYLRQTGVIIAKWNTPHWVGNYQERNNKFIRHAFGTIITEGFAVNSYPAPSGLNLHIGAGNMFIGLTEFTYPATDSFIKLYYTHVSGTATSYTNPNQVDPNYWNDPTQNSSATALIPMTSGYWKKDMMVKHPGGNTYYSYGTAEFPTYDEAVASPLPSSSSFLAPDGNAFLCTFVVQQGATTISGGFYDIRPNFARIFESESITGTGGNLISYTDLINKPFIPATSDDLTDGQDYKQYSATDKAAVAAIPTTSGDIVGWAYDHVDTVSGVISAAGIELYNQGIEYVNAYVKPYHYLSVSASGGDFQSIQAAIDSITITDFENEYWVIQVHPGVYSEDVYLKDNVDLVGDSYDTSIIDGSLHWMAEYGCTDGYWSAIQNITIQADTSASGYYTIHCDAGYHDIVNAYVWLTTDGVGGSCVMMEGGSIASYLTMYEYDHTGDTSDDPDDNHRCVRGLGGTYESEADKYVMYVEDTTPGRIVSVISQRSPAQEDKTVVVAANIDVIVGSGFAGVVEPFRIQGGSLVNSINATKLHVESLGGGTAFGYYVDSLEVGNTQSRVYSTANRVTLLGFDTDYFAHVGSQDYFASHFDDVICSSGVQGDILNYQMVSSEIDGQLRVTDHIKVGRGNTADRDFMEFDIGQEQSNPALSYKHNYITHAAGPLGQQQIHHGLIYNNPVQGGAVFGCHAQDGDAEFSMTTSGNDAYWYGQYLMMRAQHPASGTKSWLVGTQSQTQNYQIRVQEPTGGPVSVLNIDRSGGLMLKSGVRVTTILDEDTMASNTASGIPTQQSVKAYVDNTEQAVVNWVEARHYVVSGTVPVNLCGDALFSVSGTEIAHNLNNLEHFSGVTPTVTGGVDAAKVGVIYVSRGLTADTVYNTGGSDAAGLPFMWHVSGLPYVEPPPEVLSPLHVTDCGLWLVSDQGVTLDGTEVSYWEDQADGHDLGNTFEFYRPSVATNYINGHPALYFSDGYQPLFWEGFGNNRGWGAVVENWECYVVWKDTGTFSYGRFIYAPYVSLSSYNGYPTVEFADGNLVSSHITTAMSIVRFRWNSTSAWVSVNNSAEETTSGKTAKTRTIWESLDFDSQMIGYVPEIIAFPRFLDSEESTYILNYLSLRYGIAIS